LNGVFGRFFGFLPEDMQDDHSSLRLSHIATAFPTYLIFDIITEKTPLRATEPPAPGNLGNSALLEPLCPTSPFFSKGDRGGFPKGKKGRG
jgi:hypothetical protein